MELSEILQYTPALISFLFMSIVSLVIYNYKEDKNEMKKKIDCAEKDIKEFRHNYLDRFEKNTNEHSEIKILLARLETKLDTLLKEQEK